LCSRRRRGRNLAPWRSGLPVMQQRFQSLETNAPLAMSNLGAGLDYSSLTARELRTIEAEAGRRAREGAHRAAEEVLEDRRKAEAARLRKRPNELAG
jgi:hypothetical protein